MGKIFYLMGKSASGKDSIYKKVKDQMPELKPIVIYTTRPIREGEQDGVEYFFVDDNRLRKLQQAGKVLPQAYQTSCQAVRVQIQVTVRKQNRWEWIYYHTCKRYKWYCLYGGTDIEFMGKEWEYKVNYQLSEKEYYRKKSQKRVGYSIQVSEGDIQKWRKISHHRHWEVWGITRIFYKFCFWVHFNYPIAVSMNL